MDSAFTVFIQKPMMCQSDFLEFTGLPAGRKDFFAPAWRK
jgi:hypothetical protein